MMSGSGFAIFGLSVSGLTGFRVQGLGFRVSGLGFRARAYGQSVLKPEGAWSLRVFRAFGLRGLDAESAMSVPLRNVDIRFRV